MCYKDTYVVKGNAVVHIHRLFTRHEMPVDVKVYRSPPCSVAMSGTGELTVLTVLQTDLQFFL